MKKHILIILIVSLLVVSCSPSRNTGIFHINSDGSVVLNKKGTAEGDITVPSTVGGQTVKALGNAAFEDCWKLRSVTLPDTVTSIGVRAFYDCRSLTSVNLGKNVSEIGREAFYDCKSLSSITIPDGVKTIDTNTFHGCETLTKVVLPLNLEKIEASAFEDCMELKTLEYNSTKADWDKVEKAEGWNSGSYITTVHCTDGDITITE